MPTDAKTLRVLVVDDYRDGADALGLLIEALGSQVHVTYGGLTAMEVAVAFRPDLMLVDLVMPKLDGCGLVARLRQNPAFAHTKIVALTGHKDDEHKSWAMKAGFDAVLFKPITLKEVKKAIDSVNVSEEGRSTQRVKPRADFGLGPRLPIDEARRIRNERQSKALTKAECEAAICHGITCFQEEYLGWRSEQIYVHLVEDLVVIRIRGVLALVERQLVKSLSPEKGRDLIKDVRKQLLNVARPMLESLIHEVAGVKVSSLHHDISTVTGEEVVIFSLTGVPRIE